jgi:hypothetical protein
MGDRRAEGPARLPEQDRDGVGVAVGDDEIRVEVVVEVADRQGARTSAGGVGDVGVEGRATGLPDQDREGVGVVVGDDEVRVVVPVEVGDRHGGR